MTIETNDNDNGRRPTCHPHEPDAHGQAALLLAESILHMLIAEGTLSVLQGLDVVQVASEVKVQLADDEGESKTRLLHSLALLDNIKQTLNTISI